MAGGGGAKALEASVFAALAGDRAHHQQGDDDEKEGEERELHRAIVSCAAAEATPR